MKTKDTSHAKVGEYIIFDGMLIGEVVKIDDDIIEVTSPDGSFTRMGWTNRKVMFDEKTQKFVSVRPQKITTQMNADTDPVKKVFCKYCKHLRTTKVGNFNKYSCTAPSNRDRLDDWYSSEEYYKERPKNKNRNNDCPDFETSNDLVTL